MNPTISRPHRLSTLAILSLATVRGGTVALVLVLAGVCSLEPAQAAPISANLQVHLSADTGVTASGGTASAWADQTGTFVASQAIGTEQPQYIAGEMNGLPVLRFDGTDDDLVFNARIVNNADTSVYIVHQEGGNQAWGGAIYAWGHANWGPAFTSDSDQFFVRARIDDVNAVALGSPTSVGNPRLGEAHISENESVPSLTVAVGINGAVSTNSRTSIGQYPGNSMTNPIVGSRQDAWWKGDVAEIIQYGVRHNSAEATITRNYLASKWGLTLTATDVYAGDTPALGNYDREVIGIGAEADGKHSTSTGAGLTVTEATASLDPGDYLLAGHKVETNSLVVDAADGLLLKRSNRVWYLDKTGDLDATLTFDFSELGIAPPKQTDFYLLYSSENAFDFTILDTVTLVGDQAIFTLDNASLLDGYYTVAAIPEPASLALLGLGGLVALRRRR